jgi:hypothetical protein
VSYKEKAHIYHLGIGGSRQKDIGRGCNCPVNILMLTHKQHDDLDRRQTNKNIERIKQELIETLDEWYSPPDFHRYAWAIHYGYVEEFKKARQHYLERESKGFCEGGASNLSRER